MRLLEKTDDINALSRKIAECEQIKNYITTSGKEDPENCVIAYSLSEIEEACQKIFPEMMRRLQRAQTSEETFCALSDIREELRHVVYHIKDSKFFNLII
jgi:hypothetical protein